jgi:hypothetical protein
MNFQKYPIGTRLQLTKSQYATVTEHRGTKLMLCFLSKTCDDETLYAWNVKSVDKEFTICYSSILPDDLFEL